MPSGRTTTLKVYNDFPRAEKWLNKQKKQNSPGNAKQKRIALEYFDEFLSYERLILDDVDNEVMDDFTYFLDSKELSHGSIRHKWYGVRSYLNRHIDEDVGWLSESEKRKFGYDYLLQWLDEGTKTDRERDKDVHWLEKEKIDLLAESAKNLKNRLVIKLLYHTGVRPSELSRMKVDNLDRDKRRIRVKTSKVDDPTKDNFRRYVFYGSSLRYDMKQWFSDGGRRSYPHHDSDRLIVGYNTPQISPRQINKIVRRAADKAGIQQEMIKTAQETEDGEKISYNQVTPKTLRHSFSVHAIMGREETGKPPIDIKRLSTLLGHGSLKSTEHYLRFRESDLKAVYDSTHPA